MRRKGSTNRVGVLLLVSVIALAWHGCGIFDPEEEKPKPPPTPKLPPESPQDVIDNMAFAYNQMDYNRYQPLIRDGFTFWFNEDDVDNYPDIPREGYWGKSEELDSANHMLDRDYMPDDPDNKIDNMQLDMQFSSTVVPTTLVSEPPPPYGTLEGYVTFDLKVETGGGANTYLVNTRPLFYFTPDTTVTPNTWALWRIEDDTYDE